MAAPKKRGLFGLPKPVVIVVAIIFLIILLFAVLVGPIGQVLIEKAGLTITFPSWLVVPQPTPHLAAPELFHIGSWPITNTMIATWITCAFLIIISVVVTRRMKLVPGRLQAVFEFLLGWMYDFCVGIAGEKNTRKFFPVVCTIFLFVLFNAWLSLIPGYGSLELVKAGPAVSHEEVVVAAEPHSGDAVLVEESTEAEALEEHEYELVRAANTDINTTMAVAIISVLYTLAMGVKAIGVGWFNQFFNFKPLLRSLAGIFRGKFKFMDIFNGVIEVFVGVLEGLGFIIRIISFTFRLFGNMTAGEVLLLIIAFMVPWVVSPIFYGLELLIGFVQALVFAGLTIVFLNMAVTPHGEEAH